MPLSTESNDSKNLAVPSIIQPLQEVQVTKDSPLELKCVIVSDSAPDIKWYKVKT